MTGSMDGHQPAMAPGGAGAAPVRPALQMFSDSSHPVACLFHLLFKACALFLYIFGGWFSKDGSAEGSVSGANFITVTVLCILLMAADFWVVKNITGRLLVGLRWWCQVEPSGENRWIFESAETTNVNKVRVGLQCAVPDTPTCTHTSKLMLTHTCQHSTMCCFIYFACQ